MIFCVREAGVGADVVVLKSKGSKPKSSVAEVEDEVVGVGIGVGSVFLGALITPRALARRLGLEVVGAALLLLLLLFPKEEKFPKSLLFLDDV